MRQLALGDPVSPITEILEGYTAKRPGQRVHHVLGRLSRLHATDPCLLARLELAEGSRDGARRQLAKLMAADAVAVLDRGEPIDLSDLLGDIALAAELASVGNLHHRVPVDRRIDL